MIKLDHLEISVDDREEVRRFYVEHLGFRAAVGRSDDVQVRRRLCLMRTARQTVTYSGATLA